MRLALCSFPQDVDPAYVMPAGSSQSEKRTLRMEKRSRMAKSHLYVNNPLWLRPLGRPKFFKEQGIVVRITGAVLITAGLLLVGIFGR